MNAKFIDKNVQSPTPGQSIIFEAENGQRFFGNVSDSRDEIVVNVDDPGWGKKYGPMVQFTIDEIKVWLPVEIEEGGEQ